ncbi:MAG: radical SAM protein, partial [Anaerovoracaceae bacterium]
MYKILLKQIEKKYEYVELIKVFLTPDQFEALTESELESEGNVPDTTSDSWIIINESGSKDRNEIKRELFSRLSQVTGQTPPWGILTGVRPVKLTGELYHKLGSGNKVRQCLKHEYLVSDEKTNLLLETWDYQQQVLGLPPDAGVGLYIGIPFCPTRCLYCSFPSNQKGTEEIAKYLDALFTEIRYCGLRMRETGLWPESVYIGGGTPTTLSPDQLDRLLTEVETHIDLSRTKEFTVEAGRPDTITEEKLRVLKQHGIARISINPQSMKK